MTNAAKGELPDRYYTQADRTRRLGDVLKEVAREIPLSKALKHRALISLWREIVGEEVYKHTRIVGLKRGCLLVEADSATLLHHLSNFCREDILYELQTKHKKTFISSIKFKVSTDVQS